MLAHPSVTTFGRPFQMTGREMAMRARSIFGRDVDSGDPIDIAKASSSALDRFLEVLEANPHARTIIPIMDLVPQDIIKAGILYDLTLESTEQKIQKAKADILTEIDNITGSEDDITKAVTTSSNLMHNYADQQVTILFKKILPVQTMIQTTANFGKYAEWDAIPPNGAGSAHFDDEDPEIVESDMDDITKMTPVKIMYSKGRLTKMVQIAGQTQKPARDLMAIRTMASNEMIKNLRERSVLGVTRDVKATTNSFAPATAKQYAGLFELITGYTAATGAATNTAPNYITATSFAGETDPAKQWKTYLNPDLNESYRRMIYYGLQPDVLVTDYKTFQLVRGALNDLFRGNDNMVNTTFGISKLNIAMPNGIIPMIPVPFMPATAANGNIFMLDTSFLERRVLWPETFEELANINTSKSYVVSAAECLIDKTDVSMSASVSLSLQGGVFGIGVS